MPDRPQTQDHKPKKGAPFKFKGKDGKSYTLPLASDGRARLTGQDLRDASVNGEIGQLAYLFKTLEAAEPKPDALAALYAMTQDDMLEVLAEWGEHGDGDGASLGE